MADYRLTLLSRQGETWDLTQRVMTLNWTGSRREVCRSLEIQAAVPTDGSLPTPPCDLGTEIHLTVGGDQVFLGHLVAREKATGSSVLSLTAQDRGRFLAGNQGWYQFSGTTPDQAVAALCADFGVPVGALAQTGVAVTRKFPGTALSKIVDTLYTLAGEQNGRRYLARFNGAGALEVVEKPAAAALEIAPGKNLQTLAVREDISGLTNAAAIYSSAGVLIRTVEDAESAALYGRFQSILTQRDGEDKGPEAQTLLEDNGLQQNITVECLGDPSLITGNAVLLRENSTGAVGLCWIDSDTHTWKNGQYFCKLSLNFRNLMNETEAGSED